MKEIRDWFDSYQANNSKLPQKVKETLQEKCRKEFDDKNPYSWMISLQNTLLPSDRLPRHDSALSQQSAAPAKIHNHHHHRGGNPSGSGALKYFQKKEEPTTTLKSDKIRWQRSCGFGETNRSRAGKMCWKRDTPMRHQIVWIYRHRQQTGSGSNPSLRRKVVSLETSCWINDDRDSRLEGGLRVRLGAAKRLPDPCVLFLRE